MIASLFTHPYGPIDGALSVRPFISEDSHGFELFDPETGDVAAVIHDGADRGIDKARVYAEILAAAPVMLILLLEGLDVSRAEFEADTPIDGGDLVESIGAWRRKVIQTLQMGLPPAPGESQPA